jgi:ribosomal protein S18 acetylase RimI-like enzyme
LHRSSGWRPLQREKVWLFKLGFFRNSSKEIAVKNLSFRIAQAEDSEAICTLVNSAYRGEVSKKGWTTEADLLAGQRTDHAAISEMIQKPDQVFLLFEDQEKIKACVFLQKREHQGYLGMLTVNPELQAAGLGKTVLAAAERWMHENWNTSTISMTVICRRLELIAWYERRGYQNTGKKEPFPMDDVRFGIPKVTDLEFAVLEKIL